MQLFEVALEQDRFAGQSEKLCMSNHGLTANRAVKGVNCANRAKKKAVHRPLPPNWSKPRSMSGPEPEAANSPVKPARSLAFDLYRKIKTAQGDVPTAPSAICNPPEIGTVPVMAA